MITIVDYGAGNLHSVKNALDLLGIESRISSDPKEVLSAERIILPGVGAFGGAMAALREKGIDKALKTAAAAGVPILGICLGMQLFFEESEESPGVCGLGIMKGKFVKIPKKPGIKIPHTGWNSLEFAKDSAIFKDIGNEPYVYFVHSYYLEPASDNVVSAYTTYGARLAVAAEHDNIFAVQFHPEKSGGVGLRILSNFAEYAK